MTPLKHAVRAIYKGGGTSASEVDDGGIAYITPEALTDSLEARCNRRIVGDAFSVAPSNALALCTIGAGVGKSALVREPFVTNPQVVGLEISDETDHRYIAYVLKAAFERFQMLANPGVIPYSTPSTLLEEPAWIPDRPTQERIANFLDGQTARIDALIAEKERLVERLDEHWKSVVSTTVGINETAETRGWVSIPLKYVTIARCDGPFGSALTSAHYVDDGARVIRLQNIRFGEFDATDAAFIDSDYFSRELTYHSVLEGDVLIAGLGDERNFVGRACVAPDLGSSALVKADCFRFRVDTRRVSPKFVALQLSATARRDGGLLSSGSTRQRIPLSTTECRQLRLPSLSEQVHIVEKLEGQKLEHAALLGHTAEHIDRLREYRSSLISAAVTGQLNVDAFEARQLEAA